MLLQTIRDRAQGWFAYTVIGLLIIPFAVWGINYYFEGSGPLEAARVGGSKISLLEYQRAYQQQRQRLQTLFGDRLDPSLLEGPRLKQEVLQQLVDERVLTQLVQSHQMRVSDSQLRKALVALPVFTESGGFNKERYAQLLRNQGYTSTQFEEGLRHSLAVEQLRTGVMASAFVPPAELTPLAALLKQQRALSFVILPLAQYSARVTVADPEIADFFAKNPQRFTYPEQVQVQFIEVKRSSIADALTLSEEELQAAYETQRGKYTRPEERSASHILVKVPIGASSAVIEQAQARAQRIADALRSGTKTFDEVLAEARTESPEHIEGGALGVITQGMFENPALEKALYALEKVGDISSPVRMPSGFHIVRLDHITPAQVKPFAEVRDRLAQELRQERAENRFYEITQMLANLGYEHPDSLEPAAKALGVPVQETGWFSRQGTTNEGLTQQPKVIASAFSDEVLKRGMNSELLELEPGHVVMLRLKAHQEAKPKTLEEARDELIALLRDQQAREALAKDAEALKNRAAKGERLQTLAQEFGGIFTDAGLITRDAAGFDSVLVKAAFRLPHPEPGKMALSSTPLTNGDQAVFAVTQVVPGTFEALTAEERQQLMQRLAQHSGSVHFSSLLDSVRSKIKVTLYRDRL